MYIQSVCAESNSSWTAFDFTLPCTGIESLPFAESFSGYETGYYPSCWAVAAGSPSVSNGMNSTVTSLASGSLQMFVSYGIQQNMFVLPFMNMNDYSVSDIQLSFTYAGSNGTIGQAVIVGVIDNISVMSTFVPIDTFYLDEVEKFYTASEVSFASYEGSGRNIAFLVDYFTNENSGTVYVDDIRVELIPTCKRPLDVKLNSIADTTASISWSARGAEENWDIAFGPIGFDVTTANYITVSQTSYQFNGLTPLTSYQLFIRANCGTANGYSDWSNALVFETTKSPDLVPLYVDFEDMADNARWTLANGTQPNKWVIGKGTAMEDEGEYSLYITNGSDEDADNQYATGDSHVLAYRTIAFEPGVYALSFDWKGNGDGNNDFTYVALVDATKDLVAGREYVLDGNKNFPADWDYNLVGTPLMQQTTWTRNKYIFSINEAKVYNLVFYWKNDYFTLRQPPFAMDNLALTELSCSPAIELQAMVSDTSVVLSWNNQLNAPKFDVRVSTEPLELETFDNTTLGDVFNDTAFTNSITVTNLLPVTTYYAYVRTNCADGIREEWTSVEFKTGKLNCLIIILSIFAERFQCT